jgi:tripartite-type tricarboxylate transporter receptor subunit TctC
MLAKAPADGHTLLMGTRSLTMNAALYTKLPYDPAKSFIPVAVASEQANALVVAPAFPARDLPEVIKLLKASPGKYTYASTGIGSIPHLSGELFQRMTGTSIVHVPYKGGAPLIVDLMSGQVDMAFVGLATVMGQIKTGKLIPIAIASDKRSPFLPNVAAAAEAGLKGYNVDTWYGILAPAKTPMEVVKKINADVNAVLSKDETNRRLARPRFKPRTHDRRGLPRALRQRSRELQEADSGNWDKGRMIR